MISPFFNVARRNVGHQAERYVSGLLSGARRKNMEGMSEVIPEAKQEDLQHFISHSPWATEPIWRWLGLEASKALGGGEKNMILIDESGFSKKGEASVGVARQYNGRLGKVDNSQVGVFATLSLGKRSTLIGSRLFLPEAWSKNQRRCEKVGIPKEQRIHRTKSELAWELIETIENDGVKFGWVGFDAAYGRDQNLLLKIAGLGKTFVADVDCDQRVWLEAPPGNQRPELIEQSGAKRVDQLWQKSREQARPVELRIGENGPVVVQFWRQRVWIWPSNSEIPLEVWLLVSQRSDGSVKYSLSNADPEISFEALAGRQGQRYFVERSFQDGKSHLGMGHYEARLWRSWHHHMVMVGLAMYFTFLEREALKDEAPLLSVRDIVEFMGGWFAAGLTREELVARIAERHQRRRKQMLGKIRRAAAKKQGSNLPK